MNDGRVVPQMSHFSHPETVLLLGLRGPVRENISAACATFSGLPVPPRAAFARSASPPQGQSNESWVQPLLLLQPGVDAFFSLASSPSSSFALCRASGVLSHEAPVAG